MSFLTDEVRNFQSTSVLFKLLLALDQMLPDENHTEFPHTTQTDDATCFYHLGAITYRETLEEEASTSSFHLAHIGPTALIVDGITHEVLTDLYFNSHSSIIMVIEAKLAFLIHSRKGMCTLQLSDPHLFELFTQLIPSDLYTRAKENHAKYLKEGMFYV